jgi:uncharacterized membrane protein YeaQ/YmgE (transglycosylase-associated protein family)
MELDPKYGAVLWPALGLGVGRFAMLALGGRGLLAFLAYHGAGLGGAVAGGGLTWAFTAGDEQIGAFWTSLVTSVLGAIVAVGLCKAAMESGEDRD